MEGLIEKQMTLVAATLIVFAVGCERRDPQSRAITEARNTLAAAGSGGSAAAPRSALEGNYSKVLSTIKDDGGASEAVKAINASITGGALGGQGALAAGAFRDADALLLRAVGVAKAKRSLYADQRGLADSLSGYDPRADIATFDGQIKDREGELVIAKKQLGDNEAKVNGIRGRSKAKADEARSMMESLGSLRGRLLDASSADRPTLAAQLNQERRKAEGVMKESELLDAEAAKISPVSVELGLTVKQIERQIGSFNTAKESARSLGQSRSQSSAEAAKGAEQTAGELAEAVIAVRRLLADEVKPAFEAALAKLNQSTGKFGQARGGPDQILLSLSVGASAQAVGSLQREYAEVLARVSTLLGLAGNARPPIPGAADFTAAAETLASESKQSLEAALQQYEKAKSSFRSGGGSGELRERLDQLSVKLNETWVRLGGVAPEEVKAEEPAAETEAAPPTEGEPAMAPASEEAPATEEAVPAENAEQPTEVPPPGR